jgi:heme/copper-type cytochrome/quinol oxidase subunit 2
MKKYLLGILISTLFVSAESVMAEEHKHDMMKMDSSKKDVKKEEFVREIYVINEKINEKTRYSPATFIAKKGEKVRVHIYNTTDMPHGFSITELKVEATVNPKDNVIEFIADKEGLFDVFCQYHPGHFRAQLLVIK